MAIDYQKQIWKDGTDDYTPPVSARFNHMEEGIKASCDAWDSICQDFLGLRFRSVKNMRMPLNAGWSSWHVNAFDAFSDIPPEKIEIAIPVFSAAETLSEGCQVDWNTWNGYNKIEIYTPITQTLYFNMAVIWSV